MKISIILPTYNESGVILECIQSLDHQTLPDFEVILVDDGSTDPTLQIVEAAQVNNFKLKILHGMHKGAGAARNLGAQNAEGDILVFVDADMTFDRNFVRNLIKPIVAGKAKGTFSKDEYVSNWSDPLARCWNINEGWEAKRRHPKKYPTQQPVFRAILKSEFDKVGGFTPGGYDDDWSLSKKLGYQAIDSESLSKSKAIFFHKNPSSLGEIYSHAKWVGKRRYKFGVFGLLIGMIRSSLPVSILTGLYGSIRNLNMHFVLFKIVYDFGVFMGIVDLLITGNAAK